MFTFISLYLVMVTIDALWLTSIGRPIFVKYLPANFGSHTATIPAALLAWLLMYIGLWVFVLPLIRGGSLLNALAYGALFGICLYGLYELTNYAIFPNWQLPLVIIDTAWGGALCAGMAGLLWWLA